MVYRYDPPTDSLMPTPNLKFPVEVYEQGRISRLRDDVGRQLEMLDEFAGLSDLRKRRSELVSELRLWPKFWLLFTKNGKASRGKLEVCLGFNKNGGERRADEGADDNKWAKPQPSWRSRNDRKGAHPSARKGPSETPISMRAIWSACLVRRFPS